MGEANFAIIITLNKKHPLNYFIKQHYYLNNKIKRVRLRQISL